MDVAAGFAPLLNALLHVGHWYDWGRQTGPVCPDCPSLHCPALPSIPECPRCAECPALTCPPVTPCEAPAVGSNRLQKLEDLIEVLVDKFPRASTACTPCETPGGESDETRFYFGVRLFLLGVLVGLLLSVAIYLFVRCVCCRRTPTRFGPLLAVQDVETPESRRLRAELARA